MNKSCFTMTEQTTQGPRKKGTEVWTLQFSSKTALECIQKYTDTTGTSFGLLGITAHIYSYPASMLAKQRKIFPDQTSLPLPHHLNCSWDPCVRQPGLAATSPSRLLQESYYLHHHGLREVRSVRKTQPRQKEMEETQESAAIQGIFSSQLGKRTLFRSTDSKIE